MSFQKVIPLGSVGQIEIDESGAQAKVIVSLVGSLGGGSVAGSLKGKASIEIDANALELVDAGLVLLEAKLPQFAGMIAILKAAIDSQAAKI